MNELNKLHKLQMDKITGLIKGEVHDCHISPEDGRVVCKKEAMEDMECWETDLHLKKCKKHD